MTVAASNLSLVVSFDSDTSYVSSDVTVNLAHKSVNDQSDQVAIYDRNDTNHANVQSN